jgi:hypothetical protein
MFLFLKAHFMVVTFLTNEIRYYKGKHKVTILTKSAAYWIVQALENFEDVVDGTAVTVKVGEQRIVPNSQLSKHMTLPPPIKEHTYELKLEKKVKRMVEEEEQKENKANPSTKA